MAGNDRFVHTASLPVSLSPRTRLGLTKGQTPFAMILSCADSRVPPEYIFNAGLGELFVIRAAGEVVDRSIMATLEYGAEHLHIPLLVVLGHESCGAVKAVVDNAHVEGPNLEYMVKAIKAASRRSPSEKVELRTAILGNVEQVINDALTGSEILRHAVQGGMLQVVGGYYELASGRVLFSEPVATVPAMTIARAPVPVAKAPVPVARAPVPVVKAPEAVVKAPEAVVKAPEAVAAAAEPVAKAPAPAAKGSAPVAKAPEPPARAPVPVAKTPESIAKATEPVKAPVPVAAVHK
jgi:carbonic anhydrase